MFKISLFIILCRKLLIKNISVQTFPIISFKLHASRLYVALTRPANQANLKKFAIQNKYSWVQICLNK